MSISRSDIDDELVRFVTVQPHPDKDGLWSWALLDHGCRHDREQYLQGEHDRSEKAMQAGIGYIHKMRPDLVRAARKEAQEGLRYRQSQKS